MITPSRTWLRYCSRIQRRPLTFICLNSHSSSNRGFPNSCRWGSTATTYSDVSRIRNIGIIAHIDAGKTTTTERMLYYSGFTRRIGNVDDGSTTTDFLPAERARGITIQSAAITFEWPPQYDDGGSNSPLEHTKGEALPRSATTHQINLIDTPGHADFTFEVRRSLRILDGAVCILDGVAGVEAQTEQVWKQAGAWQIPRIVYVNKLDRDGAAFGRTVREIGTRLGVWPAVCQIPWWEGGKGQFTGIADVINLTGLLYQLGGDGKRVKHHILSELDEVAPGLAFELRKARIALVERLSEHDDVMVEAFLEAEEDHLRITSLQIIESLRRCLLQPKGQLIPVFAGASFRNIGVQPLLDAVVNLLPSPAERPDAEINLGLISGNLKQLLRGKLTAPESTSVTSKCKTQSVSKSLNDSASSLEGCALAFKVVNDPRKGMLVYIRVYSGSINRNAFLYNTNLKVSEKATTLLRMYASDSVPVQSIGAGQIGVIAGSKFARTGDTLIACKGNKSIPPEPLTALQLRPIEIPPPVFFTSVEPQSLREERDMHEKLSLLLREDPSLHVTIDQDSGQTLLSGMGELHLEIACDRLVNDMKTKATMGKIAIGYRETLNSASQQITKIFNRDRSDSKGKAGCTAIVAPLDDYPSNNNVEVNDASVLVHEQDGNKIIISAPSLDGDGLPLSPGEAALPSNLRLFDIQAAYLNGVLAALSRGPKYSYPMRNTRVLLTFSPAEHLFGNDSSLSALTSASRLATVAALKDSAAQAGTTMMEPLMEVDITVDEASLGSVVQDISSSRGGHIVSLGDDETEQSKRNDSGGAVIDIRKIYAPPDPFESDASSYGFSGGLAGDLTRVIKAKVPLKEMVGYLKHLRSITGGRGTFVMSVDRFEKMTAQREKAVLAEIQRQ